MLVISKKEAKMNKRTKYILAVTGVISSIMGIVYAIPSFLKDEIGIAVFSTVFIIGGLILLAISFAD